MSGSLPYPGVAALAAAVRSGDMDPRSVLEAVDGAMRASDSGPEPVHAFLAADLELALRRSASRVGHDGPLAGVPMAVKDNLATLDLPTTCGSLLLRDYRSPFEATAVRRLRRAGALIVGKTNLDEFGMGSSTEHSAFGPTRNPVDRARVPGGSSGGSAAAVAAGIVTAALGSDTGGSVRQPAAFCGVVGIKPTYGRVSRYGLVSFASSLDQVGVLARTVADAARVLEVVCGHDPLDSTSAPLPPPQLSGLPDSLRGVVVGVPREYFPDTLDPGVAAACRVALRWLAALGAELCDVSLPHTAHALPAYYVIAPAEASSNLARFDGVRFGRRAGPAATVEQRVGEARALLGEEVRRRILLGTHALSAGYRDELYARAQRIRALVGEDFQRVFASGVHVLFTPTAPTTAFALGERTRDPYEMYRSDAFTVPASLAGLPALSLPIGAVNGLPVGGQLIGRAWDEAGLLRVASAAEAARQDES